MFRLFTTYWRSDNADRRHELDLSLSLNATSFDQVRVLAHDCCMPPIPWPWPWENADRRQTFAELLVIAAACQKNGDLTVIANSDIIVPRVTLDLIDRSIEPGQVYALSRWDILGRGISLFDKSCSQDCWAMRGRPKYNARTGEYWFGVPGCDNRIAHELQASGYRMLNPSRDVRTYHLHTSQVRTSNEARLRVPLPYLFIEPHRLGEEPKYEKPNRASVRAGMFQT